MSVIVLYPVGQIHNKACIVNVQFGLYKLSFSWYYLTLCNTCTFVDLLSFVCILHVRYYEGLYILPEVT